MKSVIINLSTIDRVKRFISIINNCLADFDIKSRGDIVDGKSMMGIFSLDLSKPLELISYNCTDSDWNMLICQLNNNFLLCQSSFI